MVRYGFKFIFLGSFVFISFHLNKTVSSLLADTRLKLDSVSLSLRPEELCLYKLFVFKLQPAPQQRDGPGGAGIQATLPSSPQMPSV